MVGALGYDALIAIGPNDAMNLFAENARRIDVLLTDYQMPEMDGEELIRSLRASVPELPVVIMTGYIDSCCTGIPILEKPFPIKSLEKALDAALRTVHD